MTSAAANASADLGGDLALRFPAGFRWGVATASHQYEGGTTNNWTRWEEAGHIAHGDRSGLACDWWAHAERDFDLAQSLHLNALRLSLEWSRIEPEPGRWDETALDRYRAMLVALRQRGLEPMVTLHHFTHPLWFEDRGGFLATDAPELFARYARRVVEALGAHCDLWCTLNEPNIYAIVGYQLGTFPPGQRGNFAATLRVLGQLARAHAAAYAAIHAIQPGARVGWAQNYNTFTPAHTASPLDRLVSGALDTVFNEIFPRAVRVGSGALPFRPLLGDLGAVRDTCDFVGINTYYRDLVAFDPRQPLELFARRTIAPGARQGDAPSGMSWGEVYPQALLALAERVRAYGKPIYVTESGVADARDTLRPWVLAIGLKAVHEAIARGCDVRGYYHWSLVDNFEWAEGWGMRFGLVALDPVTQTRTPRLSAAFYSAIAQANALTPALVAQYAPDALQDVFPL